jgi:hypothetical protein
LKIFLPETTDIYDRKNMPRAVFCIHALSLIMYRNGSAPKIEDLYGRAQFTEDEISVMQVLYPSFLHASNFICGHQWAHKSYFFKPGGAAG